MRSLREAPASRGRRPSSGLVGGKGGCCSSVACCCSAGTARPWSPRPVSRDTGALGGARSLSERGRCLQNEWSEMNEGARARGPACVSLACQAWTPPGLPGCVWDRTQLVQAFCTSGPFLCFVVRVIHFPEDSLPWLPPEQQLTREGCSQAWRNNRLGLLGNKFHSPKH